MSELVNNFRATCRPGVDGRVGRLSIVFDVNSLIANYRSITVERERVSVTERERMMNAGLVLAAMMESDKRRVAMISTTAMVTTNRPDGRHGDEENQMPAFPNLDADTTYRVKMTLG